MIVLCTHELSLPNFPLALQASPLWLCPHCSAKNSVSKVPSTSGRPFQGAFLSYYLTGTLLRGPSETAVAHERKCNSICGKENSKFLVLFNNVLPSTSLLPGINQMLDEPNQSSFLLFISLVVYSALRVEFFKMYFFPHHHLFLLCPLQLPQFSFLSVTPCFQTIPFCCNTFCIMSAVFHLIFLTKVILMFFS